MEVHKSLPDEYLSYKPSEGITYREWFKRAVDFSLKYYRSEIDKASSVKWELIDPDTFFSEYIWVVHATGFSAKAVGKFIPRLVDAYGPFQVLSQDSEQLRMPKILSVCNNMQKAKAVYLMANILNKGVNEQGWEDFREKNLKRVDDLENLPYIGKVTKYHLGRNIGMLDCVKPDLHFVRMQIHWGFANAAEMIKAMSEGYGMELGIADMIAWYYASTFGTINMRVEGDR